jgi:hypothetical protein
VIELQNRLLSGVKALVLVSFHVKAGHVAAFWMKASQ